MPFLLDVRRQDSESGTTGRCERSYTPNFSYEDPLLAGHLTRYDDLDLIMVDVTQLLAPEKHSLGSPMMIVMTNPDCYGTPRDEVPSGGLFLRERIPLTDFAQFLDRQ